MALRSPHPDMFHATPPHPPHHGPPPPPPSRHYHPTTPLPDQHASPYHHQQPPSYQPRHFPTTPQTPNFASSSRSTDYPPTPTTPHYPSTPHSQHHGQPHTPVQSHHTPLREYHPSPPVHHSYQSPAGPSRLHPPPTHPHAHYQQRFHHAGSTQHPYLPSHDRYPSHPHSAPHRVMQNWSDQPPPSSPTRTRAANMGEVDVCSQFLNLNTDGNGTEDEVPLQSSTATMKVAHWAPAQGRHETEITVTLEVEGIPDPYDEQATREAQRAFRGMFGKLPCTTRVAVSNISGQSPTSRIVTLNILAPPLHMTGCTEESKSVQVFVQSLRGREVEESIHVGEFTFIFPPPPPPPHTRVQSMPPVVDQQQAQPHFNPGMKRAGEPLEQPDTTRPWSASGIHPHQRVASGSGQPQIDYGSMPPTDQNVFQFNYPPHPAQPTTSGWGHANVPGPESAPLPAAHGRNSQPRLSQGRIVAPPPSAPSVMQPTHPMVLQPPPFGQPSLIRSTQISGGTSWYERLRAEIVFQNDLLSMTRAWSQEEWQAKRRLVKVWRRQVDSQIFMAFRAITPEEYPEGEAAVVVSCIFREDKNTCYITSVDIIYLLEAVIGQRFSIEEKNRIRRNLEGFRPQTVSKNKPGSEDFFRTVMAFPDPKPRNIEKDLKVFQWDCLPGAVKKIISKYTAQYHASGEPLVPQGVTDAHHEIRAPHPNYQPTVPPSFQLVQSPVHTPQMSMPTQLPMVEGHWPHPQPSQQPQQQDMTHYDPALFGQPPPPPTGYSNGTSRQTHLQVDTSVANAYAGPSGNLNGNAYYPTAPYSPTPQMTHSSSSNVVPSEFVVSPVPTALPDHTAGPSSAPPALSHPNGGYLQQQQATAPPPYSEPYWPTQESGQSQPPSAGPYAMSGSGAFDETMYANLSIKPIEEEPRVGLGVSGPQGEGEIDVRNIYTSTSA